MTFYDYQILLKHLLDYILEKIKELGNKPLLDVLEVMGGWPLLKGADWNETDWSWENSLLNLRKFVGYKNNVFRNESAKDEIDNEIDSDIDQNLITADYSTVESKYIEYMFKVAVALGAENSEETKKELNETLELGLAFIELSNDKKFNKKASPNKQHLIYPRRMIIWLKHFDQFKLINAPSNLVQYNLSVIDNIDLILKKVSKRTIANYVLWRVVDLAVPFLGKELEGASKFLGETYGLIDKEQQWKICTRLTNSFAQLATGSLYIKEFFTEESRLAATDMVNDIKKEFQETISRSDWMDAKTKALVLLNINKMQSYIGYDKQLLNITKVEKYYVESNKKFTDTFFHLALQLNVLTTDKKFRKDVFNDIDWTKYAKPTTLGASYNQKDNSIRKIIIV